METAKRIYRPDELQPSEPIHPGEMLKDELQARGMSQKKFAAIIGMPYTAFNEIINIWRGLQSDYDIMAARRNNKLTAILDNIRKAVAVI